MDVTRHQADRQEPARDAGTDTVVPAPAVLPDRHAVPPPGHAPDARALARSNAELADALLAFQRVFAPPTPQ